jgi:FimV-like protein
MMAAALPTAGHALGLGEIHVDSALNEPLAAEIDIVGATPDELLGLIATVANRETFAHFGAERPSFLNTTTFKVTKDASGKPVLAIRSSESFTEPLIDFVVDLRWRNGQLIRQYSLLLDPAGYPAATQSAAALPVPPTQSALAAPVVSAAAAPSALVAPAGTAAPSAAAPVAASLPTIKVGPKATLRGIAWRIGARSSADLNQMMIAIYRANPSAFDGNINRLRLGATLKIPSAAEVAAISHAEANRETHAQMQAWRESPKRPAQSAAAKPAAPAVGSTSESAGTASAGTAAVSPVPASAVDSAATTTSPATAPQSADANADKAALTTKILSLEGSLQEIQAQLAAQHDKLLTMQAQVRYAEQHPKVLAAPPAADTASRSLLTAAFAGMAVLAGVCVALLVRLRRRAKTSALPSIEKVPAVVPVEAIAPAPLVRPKPAPVVVRAPAPAPIEVHEAPAEPIVEARAPKAEVRVEEHHEPSESALELSANDTSGINAAKLREELAAAKLREEIAAAWALPSAESYKREDINHESTLAQDIAKSLEDTVRVEAAKAPSEGDTIEEEAHTDTGTIVGVADEMPSFSATEVLPEPTLKMKDFPKELDADNLDYDFMQLEGPTDTEVADTVNMKAEAETAATDRIKLNQELELATDDLKLDANELKLDAEDLNLDANLKLGADDPKLSGSSIEDELASWAKKSA